MTKLPLLFFFTLLSGVHAEVALEISDLQQAEQHFQSGDYERALIQFENALKKSDNKLRATAGLARVLIEKGEYQRAKKICEDSNSLPRSRPPLLNMILAKIYMLTGQYDEARQLFDLIVRDHPDNLEARLALGKMQWQWRERDAARKTLSYFISYYQTRGNLSASETALVAEACIYLERFRDANNLFYDAVKADPDLWQAYVPWGELMLSKYNTSDARSIFEDALKVNPNAIAANLGLAKTHKFTTLESASAEKALAINPNYVAAFDYLAELDLARGNFEEALEKLDKALVVNPNSLTTRTHKAVTYYFLEKPQKFKTEENRILAINPGYGELYFEIAELLAKRYLFAESVEFYRKAIALNPEYWSAYAGLGTSLSRLGRENEAKEQLERAFAKDPYNKYVGNLLTLFDEFPQYKVFKAKPLTLRIHEDDADVLSPYAVSLAEKCFSNLLKLYKISQDREVILEIFPTHDDFAVRCFGLPGAQAFLGICFGDVVAMDSPRARSKGDFVWGETLWHELVHVTHLRLTANRIPRWLAEGIAVYETSLANPHWGMNLDWPFVMAFKNERLLPLKDLDSGFTKPQTPGQVTLSYFQASIIVEYIVDEYGRGKLKEMFPQFKKGLKTPEVIELIFDKDVEDFDKGFYAFVTKKYRLNEIDYEFDPREFSGDKEQSQRKLAKAIDKNPNNPFLSFYYGRYFKNTGDHENAITYLNKAKSLFPRFVDRDNNPYLALVEIYLERGDKEKAVSELKQMTSLNGKDVKTLRKLATLANELGDHKTAIDALEKVLYITPFDSQTHASLGAAMLAAGRIEPAIAELKMNLLTAPQDLAGAHCDLADAYLRAGQKTAAKQNALSALEIAPGYERAQEILLASIE